LNSRCPFYLFFYTDMIADLKTGAEVVGSNPTQSIFYQSG
jgi:hypothetical protein